jgi:hypothetical protein
MKKNKTAVLLLLNIGKNIQLPLLHKKVSVVQKWKTYLKK